jgi:hypothetical protein
MQEVLELAQENEKRGQLVMNVMAHPETMRVAVHRTFYAVARP